MRNSFILLTCALLAAASGGLRRDRLAELVSERYMEIANLPDMEFSPQEIAAFRKRLEAQKKADLQALENDARQLRTEEDGARQKLWHLNQQASRDTDAMSVERHSLHCRILDTEKSINDNRAQRKFGVAAQYENFCSKLDMLETWPARRKEIRNAIAAGRARARDHGDIDDIGVRKVAEGQERDVEVGTEGIRQMSGIGLMPPNVEDETVSAYVRQLADRIAAHSDLRIPLKVSVLASDEINAFSLPGGFLFVDAGLIANARRESELAGVLSHEIAHMAARHGYKLTRGISVRNIATQGAEMAANVFSGGATGTATRYVREYGIFGIGMALNLKLLGVSPETEAEANQLAIQYLWQAGYDPEGFTNFYDDMASDPVLLHGNAFFHTHPPYTEAILAMFSELAYLPRASVAIRDSARFHEIQKELEARMKEIHETAGPELAGGCEERPTEAHVHQGNPGADSHQHREASLK